MITYTSTNNHLHKHALIKLRMHNYAITLTRSVEVGITLSCTEVAQYRIGILIPVHTSNGVVFFVIY